MAGVDEDQLQHNPAVVNLRSGQEPAVAVEVVDHASTVLHRDLLAYVAAGYCVVGSCPDDRIDRQQAVEHTGQLASLLAQHQPDHRCV